MNNLEECVAIMNNMVSMSVKILLDDNTREQELKELWTSIGIEITDLNAETMTILKQG